MPLRGELPTVAERLYRRATARPTSWSRFIAVISDPELVAIILFCTTGFLMTIDAVLDFPDFATLFAQLTSFP